MTVYRAPHFISNAILPIKPLFRRTISKISLCIAGIIAYKIDFIDYIAQYHIN
jgi:hypothetical protein